MKRSTVSRKALVVAPKGRDAAIAAEILQAASVDAHVCKSLQDLIDQLDAGAALVIITEEALAGADLSALARWLDGQEEWSDFPFVLLTTQGGGLERNPAARRYLDVLGNVVFLERPFHPTTLVSLARSALRGRERQYEARARLQALRESEARFRAAVGAVQGVLWTNDAEGRMSGPQPGWQALTGQSLEAYQGYGWTSAVHPDDVEPTTQAWQSAVATRSPFIHEHRVRRASDAAWRHYTIRALPSFTESGEVQEWVGVHTDVTEQRQAEVALRESEARFRNMADNAPVMMWVTDPTGFCTYLNRRWYEFTGQTEEEGLGLGWTKATHPDDEKMAEDAFLDANNNQAAFRVEYRLRRKDGAYRWAIDAASPRFSESGAFLGYIGSVIDIDERKEVEDALRASEARLRELNADLERKVVERALARGRTWQLSPEIMGVLNEQGYFETSNPAWETVLGWSEEEVASRVFVDFVHPDDVANTQAAWNDAIERGIPALRFENRYQTKRGDYRWLSWVAVPDDRKVYCSARDVTAEKEQAEALAETEEALRQAQKIEAVGQLTGGVAHDFNNLLTIIKSSASLLRRPGLAEDRMRRYVDAISDTVDRASRLTGQLLAFARRQALKPEVLNVADRIEAVIEMLSTVVGSRIDIVSEISDEPCRVMADASQFETALVNMAVNARDAMDGEGVLTIRVHRASQVPAIRGQEAKTGEFVRIAITDTGSGIAPDQLGQIFEPFFTTKEIGKGTGLGLSQVYGFTKQSGGDVLVQSQIGSGTTFSLYLPRVEGAPETQATGGAVADGSAPDTEDRRRRVLIVEDNVDVGTFTTQILEDLGYETEWAANADEAHELLAGANGFDAVFSDVVMPGKSGIELGQEIRRRYPGLPIVLTSGYSHVLAEEGRHGFELLHKPYAAEDLSRILRRVIRDHGARQTSAVNPKTGDLIP